MKKTLLLFTAAFALAACSKSTSPNSTPSPLDGVWHGHNYVYPYSGGSYTDTIGIASGVPIYRSYQGFDTAYPPGTGHYAFYHDAFVSTPIGSNPPIDPPYYRSFARGRFPEMDTDIATFGVNPDGDTIVEATFFIYAAPQLIFYTRN